MDRDFLSEVRSGGSGFTPAEKVFLQKYMGLGEEQEPPAKVPVESAADVSAEVSADAPAEATADIPEAPEDIEEEPDVISQLKTESHVQLVGFYVEGQEFTVPMRFVQEVIRFLKPTKLPAAPSFIAGIVNLRGRIMPVIRLRELLEGVSDTEDEGGFIVVCRCKGLQLGLMVQSVKTMYRVRQEDLEWGVEAHLGAAVEYVAGLMKSQGDGKLVGIISVDRIAEKVLKG